MNRRRSSIQRRALGAALALVLPLLVGCGAANPIAPIVDPSNQTSMHAMVAKSSKHGHPNGRSTQKNSQGSSGTSSGKSSGGVTSGPFTDPGTGEPGEPLIIE